MLVALGIEVGDRLGLGISIGHVTVTASVGIVIEGLEVPSPTMRAPDELQAPLSRVTLPKASQMDMTDVPFTGQ